MKTILTHNIFISFNKEIPRANQKQEAWSVAVLRNELLKVEYGMYVQSLAFFKLIPVVRGCKLEEEWTKRKLWLLLEMLSRERRYRGVFPMIILEINWYQCNNLQEWSDGQLTNEYRLLWVLKGTPVTTRIAVWLNELLYAE